MSKVPNNFLATVKFISQKLAKQNYVLRGTASLVLQGLEMNVDDIDILCDKETALKCNEIFKDYLEEEITYEESKKYKSYFGDFKIDNIEVEVYGDWQIKDTKGRWSEPFDASRKINLEVDDFKVFVTPVELELEMFAKMGRWNAFHKIKKEMQKEKQPTLF